jgi:hypothetical protein
MDEYRYPRQSLPKFGRWYAWIFGIASIGAMGLVIWLNSDWYAVIPFAVGALLTLHIYRLVRCPRCGRRLRFRLIRERSLPNSWRYLYDCSDCRITWDSRFIQPESD